MINIGIIGSSGYVAGELLRCLLLHPEVNIDFLFSNSNPRVPVSEIHRDLIEYSDIIFTGKVNPNVDLVFLCLAHGNSSKFLEKNSFSSKTKIIDLSNDFRLKQDSVFSNMDFVYGLVELNKNKIVSSKYIANPGCFATAIELALLPLASRNLLNDDVHINSITGSTGAGQTKGETTHFSWRNNNVSIYKAFSHQHLGEIGQTICSLQKDFDKDLNFIPVRGNFSRGIFASIYTKTNMSETELIDLFTNYYKNEKFTFVSTEPLDLKQVINTNNCIINVQKHGGKVLITSVIDNLLKGAAGQAIQNMNLMFGLEESNGLRFKASYH